VQDLFSNIFYSPLTLADIGISEQLKELAMQAIAEVWTAGIWNPGENGQSAGSSYSVRTVLLHL